MRLRGQKIVKPNWKIYTLPLLHITNYKFHILQLYAYVLVFSFLRVQSLVKNNFFFLEFCCTNNCSNPWGPSIWNGNLERCHKVEWQRKRFLYKINIGTVLAILRLFRLVRILQQLQQRQRKRQRKRHLKIDIWEMVVIVSSLHP